MNYETKKKPVQKKPTGLPVGCKCSIQTFLAAYASRNGAYGGISAILSFRTAFRTTAFGMMLLSNLTAISKNGSGRKHRNSQD
jgi:hypothetical protein